MTAIDLSDSERYGGNLFVSVYYDASQEKYIPQIRGSIGHVEHNDPLVGSGKRHVQSFQRVNSNFMDILYTICSLLQDQVPSPRPLNPVDLQAVEKKGIARLVSTIANVSIDAKL